MMSIASTKKVHIKGNIKVSQGQCVIMANANAATEMKNNIQYKPFERLRTSIGRILRKNKGVRISPPNNLIIAGRG